MSDRIRTLIAQGAEAGESGFAVAFALLEIAAAQRETAAAIQRLGNGDASTHSGALEDLGMQIEKAARIIAGT